MASSKGTATRIRILGWVVQTAERRAGVKVAAERRHAAHIRERRKKNKVRIGNATRDGGYSAAAGWDINDVELVAIMRLVEMLQQYGAWPGKGAPV